jgi:hypothetical protein
MIILISSDQKDFRKTHIAKTLSETPESEVIFFDDTYGNVLDLEQYIFPSLFSISMPIIHLKFVINENVSLITTDLLKKLASSPTIFLFEEMVTPASIVTLFKKSGGLLHIDDKKPVVKKDSNIFSVTNIITNKDKKTRWLAYQKAISEYEIEAIVGILYWKIKDLISKSKNDKEYFQNLYTKMLMAHKDAWQRNVPLELTIEKVLLNS